MKRYIKVYLKLLQVNFSLFIMYRANFILGVFSSLLWGAFSVIVMLLLTSKSSTIYGWTRSELLLLTALVNVILGVYRMVFSRNFGRFVSIVHLGELDSVLLKPIDSQFQLSFWYMNFPTIARVSCGAIFAMYLIAQNHIFVGVEQMVLFFIFVFFGLLFLYSITYLLLTLTIWYPRLSNILDFTEISTTIIRYPQEMYRETVWFVFFILLPISLIVSAPTKILLNRGNLSDMFLIAIVGIVFFVISRMFWKFALRFYTSSSAS